jgi:hypothetical protein
LTSIDQKIEKHRRPVEIVVEADSGDDEPEVSEGTAPELHNESTNTKDTSGSEEDKDMNTTDNEEDMKELAIVPQKDPEDRVMDKVYTTSVHIILYTDIILCIYFSLPILMCIEKIRVFRS